MTARAILVGAAFSGAGKTTLTIGLLRAIRRRGLAVRGAKSGPDYIDPAFHQAATGEASLNLDSWAMPPQLLDVTIREAGIGVDYLVVEGAMGLFDGAQADPGLCGSAADLAARFELPVVLVVDVTGQSQTAAAVVRGLASHDPKVRIAGVLLNRVASERHRTFVADAIAAIGIPVFGAIPRDEGLVLPSRHLGLVQAGEHIDIDGWLDRLAETVERHVDLDRLLAAFGPLNVTSVEGPAALQPPGNRIALASDAAFTFMYPHLLSGWRKAGAEIVTFSPLADEPPPMNCDCCWLPGGYPELHAGALAAANRFHAGLRRFAEDHPVHGECGGYMVLGEGLEDANSARHAMVGLLGHSTSFARRRLTLGYRAGKILVPSAIGRPGALLRGHEFHYSTMLDVGNDEALVELFDGQGKPLGRAGGRRACVSGGYFHTIAASQRAAET
jgi:cobyrinic acid a,c-diamide synthase